MTSEPQRSVAVVGLGAVGLAFAGKLAKCKEADLTLYTRSSTLDGSFFAAAQSPPHVKIDGSVFQLVRGADSAEESPSKRLRTSGRDDHLPSLVVRAWDSDAGGSTAPKHDVVIVCCKA
eukprot:TRINITY_DN41702_c0_g1_i2.p1 TRINITY_DN41702_c0_g1~~TRINITY_DN41702_c0_g1_i2.p1  ORF type:complete len:119 (-),score=23.13 TRINITY_DN41702_c0_g1_i2:44-400(-)